MAKSRVCCCAGQSLAATSTWHSLTRFLGITQDLSTCISLISKILSCFQDLSSNQDLYLLLSGPLFFKDLFFWGLYLFHTSSPGFAINGLYAETLDLISILISGSLLCLFINCGIQRVPLSFKSGVFRIYKHLKPVASSR